VECTKRSCDGCNRSSRAVISADAGGPNEKRSLIQRKPARARALGVKANAFHLSFWTPRDAHDHIRGDRGVELLRQRDCAVPASLGRHVALCIRSRRVHRTHFIGNLAPSIGRIARVNPPAHSGKSCRRATWAEDYHRSLRALHLWRRHPESNKSKDLR
jgi:hypothetical protein